MRRRSSTKRCPAISPSCAPRSSRCSAAASTSVVFTSYGNPAHARPTAPCPGGHDGFDVHPAFRADAERLRKVALFVQNRFLPAIKALATCTGGVQCRDPARERMAFVDAHQAAFASTAFARAPRPIPSSTASASRPRAKALPTTSSTARPSRWRAAPRQRVPRLRAARALDPHRQRQLLHRDDVPEGVSATMQPSELHDATWGVSPPSTAAPSIRPPRAMPPWRTPRSPPRARCSASRRRPTAAMTRQRRRHSIHRSCSDRGRRGNTSVSEICRGLSTCRPRAGGDP